MLPPSVQMSPLMEWVATIESYRHALKRSTFSYTRNDRNVSPHTRAISPLHVASTKPPINAWKVFPAPAWLPMSPSVGALCCHQRCGCSRSRIAQMCVRVSSH